MTPLDWMPEGLVIPGIPPEAMPTLGLLIERAVAAGVREALHEDEDDTCGRRCDRVTILEARVEGHQVTLYGEDGRGGLTAENADLRAKVRLLVWLVAAATTTALGSVATLITTLLTNHLRP